MIEEAVKPERRRPPTGKSMILADQEGAHTYSVRDMGKGKESAALSYRKRHLPISAENGEKECTRAYIHKRLGFNRTHCCPKKQQPRYIHEKKEVPGSQKLPEL